MIPKMIVNKLASKAPKDWVKSVPTGHANLKKKGLL